MGLSEASGERDTQALLSPTQAMELRKRDYHVERPLLNQEDLDELGNWHPVKRTLPWRTWFQCSHARARAFLLRCFPILSWLPQYPVREWLLGDLLSGLSVGIMQLPQGLAYALLAGLPPVFGLYSSFYPVFIYFLFGTSRHISVGTFAVMSVMVGSLTESMVPDNSTNNTISEEVAMKRVEVASTLCFLVGCFQAPHPADCPAYPTVVPGPDPVWLCGHLPVRASGPRLHHSSLHTRLRLAAQVCVWHPCEQPFWTSVPHLLLQVCEKLPVSVPGILITAVVSMVVLVIVKILNKKLSGRLPVPIPGELLTLIGATGISYGCNLKDRFEVDIVGKIPTGLVAPEAPKSDLFMKLMGNAFTIAVVGFAIAISLGKIFALKHGYRVDSSQELVALGLSNFVGGFFHCFPISCSVSRSMVQESTGGNTQIAGALSSLFMLVVILKLGELFHDLPKAVLAAAIIVNLKGMWLQFNDICFLWKTNRADLMIWLVTFVATILLNLDLGLAVAVVFSLMLMVIRTQIPRYSFLGQVADTDIYRDMVEYLEAKEIPGVKVFRSSVTMYFANAELYCDALKKRCGVDVDYLIYRKKKLLKREKRKLKELQQKQQEQGTDASININIEDTEYNSVEGIKAKEASDSSEPTLPTEPSDSVLPSNANADKSWTVPTLKSLGLPQPNFHSLVLDLSTLSFVDTVCLKSLKHIFHDFREIEVEVYLAACHSPVVAQLEAGNFFDAVITKRHLFATVHDAVLFAIQHAPAHSTDLVTATKL
ncbi:solute carrier family 26 member 6 isoform X5 [Sorex araneus]|uniref:solute carrier family 26 member 6 isoform X5 n=1 Tax=Sorex araneus TaxID=42254 RepID=UPI002433CCB3|nr:solute carrier family 26 member 6 isoform X5 [Sorex araneus]